MACVHGDLCRHARTVMMRLRTRERAASCASAARYALNPNPSTSILNPGSAQIEAGGEHKPDSQANLKT
jgi:hypothetical protein